MTEYVSTQYSSGNIILHSRCEAALKIFGGVQMKLGKAFQEVSDNMIKLSAKRVVGLTVAAVAG